MNKLIWKGIDSSTIKGLLICELPPITKPKMRVQETVIDGVDGSIIEELGYESYDKTIKIGLTYDFDIDEIIKYFSGEGEVVFSNEPDKYYKASILNRIDYERLLRFREATVKFRVQPFKYQYQEEKLIAKTGSVEGTEIKISDVKAIQLQIDGRSTQDGTPTPDTPVEIESVGYENSFDIDTFKSLNSNNSFETYNGIECLKLQGKTIDFSFDSIENMQYTFRFKFIHKTGGDVGAFYFVYDDDTISEIKYTGQMSESGAIYSKTSDSGKTVVAIRWGAWNANHYIYIDKNSMQLEEGTQQHSYIPYGKYGIEVKTTGKNKLKSSLSLLKTINTLGTWDGNKYAYNGVTYTINDDLTILVNGTASATSFLYLNNRSEMEEMLEKGEEYKLNGCPNGGLYNTYSLRLYTGSEYKSQTTNDLTFIFGEQTNVRVNVYSGVTVKNLLYKPMIRLANDDDTHQPYQKITSVIELNEPLRSLPNGVKDIAYIKNNKLYVDRYVGKHIFKAVSRLTLFTNGNYYGDNGITDNIGVSSPNIFSNRILGNYTYKEHTGYVTGYGGTIVIFGGSNETVETFNGKYEGTEIYYGLATPVTEEYGDITILDLLDGENNISNSEDANMIVDYIETLNVNNMGNHTAKPIFEIEGVGKVDFILNNSNVFSYNFDDDGKVVIDSEKEDAYLGLILKNRNMNGDFPIFNPGENKFTWDGLIKNISVSKKSRWL